MILIFCCYSVLVYVLSNSIVLALDHDNNLVAKPEVQCGVDNIIVSMNTLLPFKGRLYVDGESEKENCVRHTEVGSKNLKFDISIGECNMRRQRTLHPRGIAFSFTLIVSFHPFFVTGQDKAFNIRCFFLESVKNLNTGLEVGILTTEVVEQDVPLPMCTYQLRGGDNGEKINFAQVGQKVTHVWHCDEEVSHVYGILIHSCYADDGRGNKFQLVDDQGCTTDPALLPQIEYESESITAVTHANVFKYADKVQLYFTCTVQLCYRHDGGCEGVTPPVCSHHSNGPPVQKFENQLDNIETHPENHDPSDKQNIPLSPPQKHSTLREDEAVMSPKPVILPSPNEMSRHFIGSLPKEIQLKAHNSMEFFNNIQKQSPRPPNHSREISNRDIHMSKLPYKDSPLNETEIEDIPTQDENTTGKSMKRPLLLPKNVGQVSNNDNSVGVKQRRHLKNMEADVSVEMLVLPPEIESKKETTNGSQFNIKSNNNNIMAEFDLTQKMVPFFDLHLVIPLLEFVEPRKIYDEKSFIEVHRRVLRKTNMIDSLIETYPDGQIPKDLQERKAEILKERDAFKAKVDPIVEILEREDVKELMENTRERDGNSKILDFLQQNHEFTVDMVDTLFKYAKFMYECGNYTAASVCLYYYRNLIPHTDNNYLNALYGKLASEILVQEWDHARDDLVKLRAYIDSNPFDTEWELVQQRAWLMHWALFVYFNYPKGRDEIIEMFLNQQNYLNTIQAVSPHLLRYLAVAVVTSKNKQKNSLKDLIKVIDIERHNYQDPVTDFLTCLYIKYDFDQAQEKLRECEEVLSNDFFLTACLPDFRESARLLIFEMFCRIHQCISIEMLARRLNMTQAEAERWIVDLIRNYRIEGAKIDSKLGQVVMGVKAVSIHEQVMENTKRLTLRTHTIGLQLEKARNDRGKTTI